MKFGLLQLRTTYLCVCLLAEGVGFEPTVGKPTPVFKTGSFGRSDTLPSLILVDVVLYDFQLHYGVITPWRGEGNSKCALLI